jgi:hypothetical protein
VFSSGRPLGGYCTLLLSMDRRGVMNKDRDRREDEDWKRISATLLAETRRDY